MYMCALTSSVPNISDMMTLPIRTTGGIVTSVLLSPPPLKTYRTSALRLPAIPWGWCAARTERETSSVTASRAGPEPGVRKVLSSHHRGHGNGFLRRLHRACVTSAPVRTVSVTLFPGRPLMFCSLTENDIVGSFDIGIIVLFGLH